MGEDEQDTIQTLYTELQNEKAKNSQLNQALASSSFAGSSSNPIEYLLDSGEILAKTEHFLRGDELTIDSENNEVWKKQKNKDKIIFNDYGVSTILAKLSTYLDKINTLSYYDEDRIYEIIADFGDEIRKFIYTNQKQIGLDTDFKKSNFTLTVVSIIHIVESNYRRAIHGRTLEKSTSNTIYTHSDNPNLNQKQQQIKKFSLFRPSTW